jgi:hypothetical protein
MLICGALKIFLKCLPQRRKRELRGLHPGHDGRLLRGALGARDFILVV